MRRQLVAERVGAKGRRQVITITWHANVTMMVDDDSPQEVCIRYVTGVAVGCLLFIVDSRNSHQCITVLESRTSMISVNR